MNYIWIYNYICDWTCLWIYMNQYVCWYTDDSIYTDDPYIYWWMKYMYVSYIYIYTHTYIWMNCVCTYIIICDNYLYMNQWRADSLEKTLMLGKTEGKRRRGWQRIKQLDSIIDSMGMYLSKLSELEDRGAWCAAFHGSQRVRHNWATEQQQIYMNQYVYWYTDGEWYRLKQ